MTNGQESAEDKLDSTLEELKRSNEELEWQKSRLRQLAHDLAAAEHRERKRVAAFLHDELQQKLVGLKMQLFRAGRTDDEAARRTATAEALELLDDAIDSSRRLTHQLRPPVLYEDGLVAALRWLGTEMAEQYGLGVTVEAGEIELALDEDIRAMLFESARELLFNIVKHAEVDEAVVRVEEDGERLRLTVSDEGLGFDAGALATRGGGAGLGLFRIRERMESVDGAMEVDSVPGDGARVSLTLPVEVAVGSPAEGS